MALTQGDWLWVGVTGFGALMGWTFVARYAVAAHPRRGVRWRRWWRSATGWNLMVLTTSVATAFTLLALDQLVGPFPRVIWFVVVLAIDVAVFHRCALLFYDSHREE